MPTSTQELQSFQTYAAARIQNGGAMLELDDLLEEWKCRNSAAKPSLSGTCCAIEDDRQRVRDRIVRSLDQQGAKPVKDPSGMICQIAPDGETADEFMLAVGRSQDTGPSRDCLND